METPSPIITITSDFGWRDYHLALIKGTILCQTPEARIVDISHEISNYNIVEGAFLFRHAWQAFPKGTIHLVSINDFGQPDRPFLVFAHQGHYFVGPDNGLFSLVFQEQPDTLFQLAAEDIPLSRFPLADIFAKATGHLAKAQRPEELGSALDRWVERITLRPVTGPNHIRGSVVYIDEYDNAILNIDRELMESVGQGRAFELFFKRHSPITELSDSFYDVAIGEILCRFNSANLLEIAINMDRGASLLGLKVEDTIQIDFSHAIK